MSLTRYKEKRSFSKTPEPGPGKKKNGSRQLIFVIQKHHASHLHYDFRLEMKGVLKSWAVPKGPSMNPADKRLAMHVEDHPYDYKDFEGIIPKGNYGAGTVIIWDQGHYTLPEKKVSVADMEKQLLKDYYKGSLRIILHGKKLKGEFALVKTSGREENAWLLIKKNDSYALKKDITANDRSIVSGKTIEQIRDAHDSKQWISNRKANGELKSDNKKKSTKKSSEKPSTKKPATIKNPVEVDLKKYKDKKKAGYPKNLSPMLATLTDETIDREGWSYEIKWDGYRALAYVNGEKSDMRSRNNKSFNDQFYPIYDAIKGWPVKAVVDGEIVAVTDAGVSSFQQLQNWRSESDGELLFYVFDLLWYGGYNLTGLALKERRDILQKLIPSESIIKFSEAFESKAADFLEVAAKMGMEGILAKKDDSVYLPGTRSKNWLKIKTGKRHEVVIGGYTLNENSSKLFSSLLVGVNGKEGLQFIGQVGTGFTDALQKEIMKKLKSLQTKKCPFSQVPEVNRPSRFRHNPPNAEVFWVKPKLVCEVQYQELTGDSIMRHPSFQGMRTDKDAKDVVWEKAIKLKEDKPRETAIGGKTLHKPVKTRAGKTLLNPHEETQSKKINGHELKFTNLSKLYWPKEKISKRDMLNYYYEVTPYMLPYMKDRPQSLNRHPNGINGPSFYQKNVAGKIPSWLTTHDYENTTTEGSKKFLVCTDEASLLYIANLGCIEMNPWHSRIQSPDKPDWCVIDLDPDTNSFNQVIEVAQVIRKILESAGIPSWPKTSGSTGIHIYIPLGAKYDYDQSRMLAELIVSITHRELPTFTSLERSPSKRKGLIYLDFLQNRTIQTLAAPYSLRPKPGATASAPLYWDEIKKGLSISDFTIYNMPARIKDTGDIFKGVLEKTIDLDKVLKKIGTLFS